MSKKIKNIDICIQYVEKWTVYRHNHPICRNNDNLSTYKLIVSIKSTHSLNMSKKIKNIDVFTKYVEKLTIYRHIS